MFQTYIRIFYFFLSIFFFFSCSTSSNNPRSVSIVSPRGWYVHSSIGYGDAYYRSFLDTGNKQYLNLALEKTIFAIKFLKTTQEKVPRSSEDAYSILLLRQKTCSFYETLKDTAEAHDMPVFLGNDFYCVFYF